MEALKLPRVTEILHCFAQYRGVPRDVLENAAARGTKVHGLCACVAQDLWVPPMLDELKPYVESFTRWHDSQVKRLILVEKRLHDKNETYTGQIDFVFELNDDKTWLVDIKTCQQPMKSHPVQMAAYIKMLIDNGIQVEGAQLVYLPKTGKDVKVLSYTMDELRELYGVFAAALKCYYYFNAKKAA